MQWLSAPSLAAIYYASEACSAVVAVKSSSIILARLVALQRPHSAHALAAHWPAVAGHGRQCCVPPPHHAPRCVLCLQAWLALGDDLAPLSLAGSV